MYSTISFFSVADCLFFTLFWPSLHLIFHGNYCPSTRLARYQNYRFYEIKVRFLIHCQFFMYIEVLHEILGWCPNVSKQTNKQTNCLEFIFCPYSTSSFGCIIAVLLLQYYCNYFSLQKLNQVLFSLMVLQVRTYLVKYVENRVGGKKENTTLKESVSSVEHQQWVAGEQ